MLARIIDSIARLLAGMTRSRLITVCGLITVAVGVTDPGLFEGHPRIQALVITVGAIAAAVGRALMHGGPSFDRRTLRSLALLLALIPVGFAAGCDGGAKGARAGAEAVSYAIDEARAMRGEGEIDDAAMRDITLALRDANDAILEASEVALSAGRLDGTVADYVTAGLRAFENLNARGTLHIKNDARRREWGRRVRLARAGLSIYRLVTEDEQPAKRPPGALTAKTRPAFERALEMARENRARIDEDLSRLRAQ